MKKQFLSLWNKVTGKKEKTSKEVLEEEEQYLEYYMFSGWVSKKDLERHNIPGDYIISRMYRKDSKDGMHLMEFKEGEDDYWVPSAYVAFMGKIKKKN